MVKELAAAGALVSARSVFFLWDCFDFRWGSSSLLLGSFFFFVVWRRLGGPDTGADDGLHTFSLPPPAPPPHTHTYTIRDSRLSTPLHLVAMRGYHDVGMTLIAHGADVNARDMSQVTPLRHAAYRGEEAIVRLLLHFGADPTIPDAQGGKPLEVGLPVVCVVCVCIVCVCVRLLGKGGPLRVGLSVRGCVDGRIEESNHPLTCRQPQQPRHLA